MSFFLFPKYFTNLLRNVKYYVSNLRSNFPTQDTNNHDPVFPQTSTYLIIQDPFLTVGRFVGQVTATDADRSEKYGKIYYSFLQVPEQFSESYLYINDLGRSPMLV